MIAERSNAANRGSGRQKVAAITAMVVGVVMAVAGVVT
jgi:hypothetical protein